MSLKNLKSSTLETRALLKEFQASGRAFAASPTMNPEDKPKGKAEDPNRVWGKNTAEHRALVQKLSELTKVESDDGTARYALNVYTKAGSKLIRNVDADPSGVYDTFEKTFTKLKTLTKLTPPRDVGIDIKVWDKKDPPSMSNIGSGAHRCFRVQVPKPSPITGVPPGIYVVPYATKDAPKEGAPPNKSQLLTRQMLGFGAENAVWAAMEGEPPVWPALDEKSLSKFGEFLSKDNRLISMWPNAGKDAQAKFVQYCNHMAQQLANNSTWGSYALTKSGTRPGEGSTTAAEDLKGISKSKGGEYNISVKYGPTQRLGAVRLELNKPPPPSPPENVDNAKAHNSSVAYKSIQGLKPEGSDKTWDEILSGVEKGYPRPPKEKEEDKVKKKVPAPPPPSAEAVKKAAEEAAEAAKVKTQIEKFYKMMTDMKFEELLEADVRSMLGISKGGGSTKTLLVKFTEVTEDSKTLKLEGGIPSVYLMTSGGGKIDVTVRRPLRPNDPPRRGRMYIVTLKIRGRRDLPPAVLEVELGAKSQDKAVTLHVKGGDEEALEAILNPPESSPSPAVQSESQRPRRESSSSTSARGTSVPLGKGPDGKPDKRKGEEILSHNAEVYGKSWGDAKRVKEGALRGELPEMKSLLRELFDIE